MVAKERRRLAMKHLNPLPQIPLCLKYPSLARHPQESATEHLNFELMFFVFFFYIALCCVVSSTSCADAFDR